MYQRKASLLAILAVVVLAISFAFQQPVAAGAPANDLVATPVDISALPFSEEIDTSEATIEPADQWSCSMAPYYTVWYRFTPAASMTVKIETIGSSFWPLVTFYDGDPAPATEVYCTKSPIFEVTLTGGTTYYIRFSSYSGSPYGSDYQPPAGGMLRFTITQLQGPENDFFADARDITLDGNNSYSDVVNNQYATTEAGELPRECGTPYHTVWYKFTPAVSGRATANYYGSYAPFVMVYTGDSLENITPITYSCYWYTRDFVAQAGTTYYIQVGVLYDWATSQTDFTLSYMLAPANDDQASPEVISALPFYFTGDLTAATADPLDPSNGCGLPVGKTLWYRFAPDADMDIEMTYLSGWYVSLTLFRYSQDTGFAYMRCVYPNATTAQTRLVLGDTYYFMVSAPDYANTPFQFQINQIIRPPNDDFASAALVDVLPFNAESDITNASTEGSDPWPQCSWGWGLGKTVWYQFTPEWDMLAEWDIMSPYYELDVSIFKVEDGQFVFLGCALSYDNNVYTRLSAGASYYFMINAASWVPGPVGFHLGEVHAPPNDNFVNAQQIEIPFSYGLEISAATMEAGEPAPSCASPGYQSAWFAFTPDHDGFINTQLTNWWDAPFMAIYNGAALEGLTELACRTYNDRIVLPVTAGQAYYIQLGSLYEVRNWVLFDIDWAPPPVAGFGFWPGDPSIFDTVYFWDSSYDPLWMPITSFEWDFGDGALAEGYNPSHQYAADGDYTVWHRVTTEDGRQAVTTQLIQVRTHDVAITRFTVPQAAAPLQTRPISVGIRNTRYPEYVYVDLYKSVPSGWEFVGTLRQYVPVRAANRTTDFIFKYTFTKADAAMGKVNFKAEARIDGYRDALPADNMIISLPTKVGK